MRRAVNIAELKYPKSDGWRHAWIFDHSSCHAAMVDDALDVNKMNVHPGGKQRLMNDTIWNGMCQSMTFMQVGQRIAKGMEIVLQERGISTHGKKKEWMQATLSKHSDFRKEHDRNNSGTKRPHTHIFAQISPRT